MDQIATSSPPAPADRRHDPPGAGADLPEGAGEAGVGAVQHGPGPGRGPAAFPPAPRRHPACPPPPPAPGQPSRPGLRPRHDPRHRTPTAGQDRPQGTAVVRPARCRLLPRAAARPPGPRRPAREPPVLEDPDRVDRPRHHLQGRPDLRPLGLRQVVAGQGGVAAPAGQGRPGGLHRGDRGGDRGPAARGAAQGMPRICPPGWAWSTH